MKKHLAILCGIFYPNPSATGQCTKRFAELLSDAYEIDIICMSDDETTAEVDTGQGIRIHKIAGRRMGMEARSRGGCKKLLHLLGGVQIKTQLLGNLKWYRDAARRKLEEICAAHKLDVVFSVCSPFAAHCAAMDFKRTHPAVHWCGYTVDPYAAKNRIRPFWCGFERLIAEERAVLQRMDTVLLSEEVYKNRPELFRGCSNCRELPYMLPAVTAKRTERTFFDAQNINCVYAGSFYRDVRNPECMLRTFSRIKDPGIKLHLFSSGCDDLVRTYTEQSPGIVLHPRVSVSEIAQVYQETDVLVNIENSTEEFMPSKTFEYIATGKPIVNFYCGECGGREALELYPLCFQVRNAPGCEDATGLEKFLSANRGKSVSAGELEKIYSKYSRERISEILHDAMLTLEGISQNGD